MVSITKFTCKDLLKYNDVNFDPLTETYNVGFYMNYLARWPEYFVKAEDADGNIVGYSK